MSYHWLASEMGNPDHLKRVKQINLHRETAKLPILSPHIISGLMQDKDPIVRRFTAMNHELTPDQITHHLKHDPDYQVRMLMLDEQPHANREHLKIALNDPHEDIRKTAHSYMDTWKD